MVLPEELPKYSKFDDAKKDADKKGVIDADLLPIPGPSGEILSNLFKGFEKAYFDSGVDLSQERFLQQAAKALSNLWIGLTNIDERYLEAIGSGKTLPGVDVTAISPPKNSMEVLQESIDIYLGLVYSYAVEIFDSLTTTGEKEKARIFAQSFFEATGVKLLAELEGGLKEAARARIEDLFNLLVRSERMIKGNDTNQEWAFKELDDNKINSAGILPLVKKFFPEQEEKWNRIFDLLDGFGAGCEKGGLEPRQFGWDHAWEEARKAIASEIEFSKIREIAELPEFSPIVTEMVEIFKKPQEYDVVFLDDDGKEINYSAIPPADRPDVLKGKKKKLTAVTNPNRVINKKLKGLPTPHGVRHNYARDGDPNADQELNGAFKATELIKERISGTSEEVPDHVISSVWMLSIVGELRMKYFSDYYSRYLKSPDPTFEAMYPISTHVPMSRILYAIRAYRKISPKMRLLFQVMRLPKQEGDYQELATRKSTRDRKNHPNNSLPHTPGSIPPELDLEDPSFDGLEDEYNPPETPVDPATNKPDKENPATAMLNDFVSEAMEVRTMMDYNLTLDDGDFTPVRLDEDLVVLPHYWDILFPDPADPDYKKYKDITFKQYNAACTFHNEFLEVAQDPVKVLASKEFRDFHDIKNIIGGVSRKISPFKGLFALMNFEKTERGSRHIRILQEIMLRVIKNVYDQFMAKTEYQPRLGEPLTKHKFFIHEAIAEIKMGTLIPEIQNYLIDVLEKANGWGTTGLFSLERGDSLGVAAVSPLNYTERARRENLLAQYYSEEPPPDEKK